MKVQTRTIELATWDGASTRAFVAEPDTPGPHPAIVFGAEAFGLNDFIRETAVAMAERGFVTVTPDYYRGDGPKDPENYSDFTEVFTAIQALDFRAATYDLMAAADWLRGQPQVDSGRIAVWGYCTGGTMALMAACLDRRLAAAVLFFPSQPVFEELNVKRPAHPMDLIWNIGCPVILHYGDQDQVLPPNGLAEFRRRFEEWGITHDMRIYPGAGHAFTAKPSPVMYNEAASDAAWAATQAFLDDRLGPPAAR
jgi:carboxymethylenebutenolidase